MDRKHIRTLQREVNVTLDHAELDWLKIPVDGKLGPLTCKHARIAGSWQGLSKTRLAKIGKGQIDDPTFEILTHRRELTPSMHKRHHERLHHFKELRYHHAHPPQIEGLVSYDGEQVPAWIVEEALEPARKSGVWTGEVFSGVRSPEYSEHLCIIMCGAPTCSGRCGGRYSNHACPPSGKGVKYEGAVDCTDAAGLRSWTSSHGHPIRGGGEVLPADTPHFSRAGN